MATDVLAAAFAARTGVRVLVRDPELGSGIGADDFDSARDLCQADLVVLRSGKEVRQSDAADAGDLVGLVIVSGLLCREIAIRDRHMLELLGPGDVLQLPVAAEGPRLGRATIVTTATDAEMLALRGEFIRAAARWPCLLASVQQRLEIQRERLAVQGLIAHLPRAEHRVLLILWHLAHQWGFPAGDGTVLSLPLTHQLISQLAAARRSTTTLALKTLERGGELRRLDDGSWLITASGERLVHAMAAASPRARPLGEALALHRSLRETSEASRALRAQARLIRDQRRG